MVRVLRELDPTGAVLEHAGAPVRAYLRNSRSDTIRCLVSMLTGDASEGEGLDSLQEELTRMEAVDSDGDDADADAEVAGCPAPVCEPHRGICVDSLRAWSEWQVHESLVIAIFSAGSACGVLVGATPARGQP